MRDNRSDTTAVLDHPEDGASADSQEVPEPAARRRPRFAVPSTRLGKIGAALAVVALLAAGLFGWKYATGLPDDAAFAIGDEVVTRADLDHRAQALRALYGVERPQDPGKLDAFRRDLAKSVAVSMILDQEAEQRGIVIADRKARDVLDRYIAGQFGDGGREAFVRSLANVGTSEPAVLEEIKRQLAVGRLMDEVVGQVSVGDDALRSEFGRRKAELETPERRVVRNIVVGARQEALDVLRALRSGAAIEQLAAQRSLDASTRNSGGSLGEMRRDQLEPGVSDAVFAAAEGAYYGPVQGRFGWNVGRVDRVLAVEPARFDAVKHPLRETLIGEETLRRWRDWLGEVIRAADVEYAPEYRPKDPDSPPTASNPATPDQAERGPR